MHRRAFAAALAATASLPALRRTAAQPATPAADSPFRAVEVDGTPIALSADGTILAGVTPDHTLAFWDAATFERISASDPVDELRILDQRSLTWSPDGSAVAFSLDGLRTMYDSDIFTVEVASGDVTNLTDEAPGATPASMLDGSADAPILMDLFPTWSPDGTQIAFARTVSMGGDGDLTTDLMSVPRDGGEAREIAVLSTDTPFIVSGPMTWLDDDTILYATWPPRPDQDNGVFLAMPDGSTEIVSTGLLAASMPSPILVDVNVEAGLASVVSSTNLGRGLGDPEADIAFIVDLRTGIPTPVGEILPIPAQKGSTPDEYVFASPPAITVADGRTLLTYALIDREAPEVWQYEMDADEATHLGTLPPPVEDANIRAYFPTIDIGANGAMFVTGWNGTWISTSS